jgi:hypothetical protein
MGMRGLLMEWNDSQPVCDIPWHANNVRFLQTANGSAVTGKTLSDLIEPSIKRVKSGVKRFVVKVKNIPNCHHPKKPVVMFQVPKRMLGCTSDESDEA